MKRLPNAILPALLISITALLLWGSLTKGHNWGDDFAAYIMQAQSITKGAPSAYIEASRFTVEQSSYVLGAVAYPWGFPVLLAPVYALFGLNMIALKSVGVVCFLLFLFLLWRGFRIHHSDSWRLVLLCLFGLNPTLLRFMDNILSDIPFLLVSTFCVLLMGRLVVERRRLISPACDQLLLGAAIAAAFVIRINGILLLVTLGFTQLVALIRTVYGHDVSRDQGPTGLLRLFSQKHGAVRHMPLYILPYVSFVSLVLMWRALLPTGNFSQASALSGVSMELIRQNVHYYIDVPVEFFEGVPHDRLVYGASIPLAIAGAMTRFRTDHHAIAYVALTFLLFILWPPTAGLRFIIPVLPFYLSFVLSALEQHLVGMTKPARVLNTAVCLAPIVLVLLYFGKESGSDAVANLARHRAGPAGPFVETSRSMFSYIRENTDALSRIAFFKPRAMMMMTGRRSLKTYNVRDLSHVDYVSLYRPDEALDQIVLPDEVRCMTENGIIRPVYKNEDFVVYRVAEWHQDTLHADEGCASLHPAR